MFAPTFRSLSARMFAPSVALLAPLTGKCVSWMGNKGFGFVEDNTDKKQHFVHFSAVKVVPGAYKALDVGQEVEFEVVQQDGKLRADNVTAIGGAPLPGGTRPPGQEGGQGGFRGGNRGGGGGDGYRGNRGGGGGGYRGNRGDNDGGNYNRGGNNNNDDF